MVRTFFGIANGKYQNLFKMLGAVPRNNKKLLVNVERQVDDYASLGVF